MVWLIQDWPQTIRSACKNLVEDEAELLLDLVRADTESRSGEQRNARLERNIDWGALLRIARRHGVMPMLYQQLSRTCSHHVPQAILTQLEEYYHANLRCNLILAGELFALRKLFDAQGISAIAFKGLTLAVCAYENLALRDIGDLDLLIRPRDLAKAAGLLLGQGYQPMLRLNGAQEAAHLRSIGQLPFVHPHAARMVELHTSIMPRPFYFPLDFERVWERRIPLCLCGKEVSSLAPEHLLLVLCAHGTKHHWVCLKWIGDLAQLVQRRREMNWEIVRREARRLAAERMLFLGLALAWKLLGAPVPPEIRQGIRKDPVVESLAAHVRRNLFRPSDRKVSGFENALFHLRTRERLRDGLRYTASIVMAPTVADWQWIALPPFLCFLYYLLRPVRLAGRYGRRLYS